MITDPGTSGTSTQGVAAFDFDGTLARRDTMMPFLVSTHGLPRLAGTAVSSVHRARVPGTSLRDGLKVATVGQLFRGMTATEFTELAESYAATLADLLRDELVAALRWHQEEGHATVIVSASLAAYLRPVAADLDIDEVLGVELVADGDGVLTGEVEGGRNTRGAHKVTRLRNWVQQRFDPATPITLWAYGDSSGDRELLAAADHPTWISQGS